MASTPKNWAPHLKNLLGENLTVAEIGVAECGNVDAMLNEPGLIMRLLAIDSWVHYGPETSTDSQNVAADIQTARYCGALNRAKTDSRLVVMRMESMDAVCLIRDESLDAAYIDANHRYEWVDRDIRAWWLKIRSGGYLAGHDYRLADKDDPVVRAADGKFKTELGLEVHNHIPQGDGSTWWVQKPESK